MKKRKYDTFDILAKKKQSRLTYFDIYVFSAQIQATFLEGMCREIYIFKNGKMKRSFNSKSNALRKHEIHHHDT